MSKPNSNDYLYATVVPVAAPATGDGRPALPREQHSSYRLPVSSVKHDVNEDQIRELGAQGFTRGLAKALSTTKNSFPLRIWVVDNSGSMQKNDGHRIVETTGNQQVKILTSTRWAELQECVNYHAQMAAMIRAPTSFRLLNDPGSSVGSQQFGIAESGNENVLQDVQTAREIMRKARPNGVTPLTQHINEIQTSVQEMAPQLIREGQRVAIILATDGLPTDEAGYGGDFENQRFVSALRSLEGLPVWVVIRLCTDEESVVSFYNDLDEQLELSLEVLDDFVGEAEEVYDHNKWLNYALPLHRCRELGFHDRVFDMLDERPLTMGELRDFCAFLFGVENFDGVPDPAADWLGFLKEVDRLVKNEGQQWNPIKKKATPWIDMKALNKKYGDGSSCIIT